ncbi:MAG: hypothetical protein IKM31_04030 [Oscillospiraceae bacterium]|nr:hypothetical protein [Oscillospiraceae bacterium]
MKNVMKVLAGLLTVAALAATLTGCADKAQADPAPEDVSGQTSAVPVENEITQIVPEDVSGQTSAFPIENESTQIVPEDAARQQYIAFLAGDYSLLDSVQTEKWWIPNLRDDTMQYEYIFLDLDGDDVSELLVQTAEDPRGYNAVFHFEDGRIFCWNSDAAEMNCRDYPLSDGTMVRQYDFSGTRSYTLFRYLSGGETEELNRLFARDELIDPDSTDPCPYYEADGKELSAEEFSELLNNMINSNLPERSSWTEI